MRTVDKVIERVANRINYIITQALFDIKYLGIDYRIERVYKKARSRAIFEIKHLWAKKRITRDLLARIEEAKKNNKNLH